MTLSRYSIIILYLHIPTAELLELDSLFVSYNTITTT